MQKKVSDKQNNKVTYLKALNSKLKINETTGIKIELKLRSKI
jgi:hypothetical protein